MRPAHRFHLVSCTARMAAGCAALVLAGGAVVLAGCGRTTDTGSTTTTTTTTTGAPSSSSTAPPAGAAAGTLHFSAPRPLARATGVVSVSCGGTGSCIALDGTGRGYHFDGAVWSAPVPNTGQPLGPGASSVSCASPALCIAIPTAGSQVVRWNGQGWSALTPLEGANGLEAVGCAPTQYCAAVDAEGDAFAFDGQSWHATSGDWGSVSSISCVSSSLCMSVSGGISQWDGRSWTQPGQYGTTAALNGVSCATATFCTAVGQTGEALQWNGHRWSTPVRITAAGTSLTGVSCASSSFCAAVDGHGRVLQWTGGAWTRTVADAGHRLTSIACPSPSFCVAGDQSGNVIVGRP